MPTKLSSYYQERFIALCNHCQRFAGTVRRWIFHWEQDHGLQDDFSEGRPSKITSEILEYLERWLEKDKTNSVELQRLVARKFGGDISAASIRRYLHVSLHLAVVRTRYGHAHDINRQMTATSRRGWNSHGCAWRIVMIWTTLSRLMSHRYH